MCREGQTLFRCYKSFVRCDSVTVTVPTHSYHTFNQTHPKTVSQFVPSILNCCHLISGAIRKLFGTAQQFVQPTLVHTSEQPSSKILNLYGTKELGTGATTCSGVRVPDFFSAASAHQCRAPVRDVATVFFTPVLAYIVDGLSATSSMLLNLCMYTPVSINLLSSKHCRYAIAVIFTFLIKCSICYLLYMSKNLQSCYS